MQSDLEGVTKDVLWELNVFQNDTKITAKVAALLVYKLKQFFSLNDWLS